jgi:hypothetical protein
MRKRLAFFLIFLLVAGALDALLAPLVVAQSLRFWLRWMANRQGLSAEMAQVDAPFLRPVTVRQFRLTPGVGKGPQVNLKAATVVIDLNLSGWIFGRGTALLHSVEADDVVGSLSLPQHPVSIRELDWKQLAQLLPENFRVADADLEITGPSASVGFRGLRLSASAIESGKFFAREVSLRSPVLRQTFRDLRGATSWESARLTIAGIPLALGLDLEALTLDLSHLAKRRLGIDLHLDTYGGTLRASLEGRTREKFVLDVAGSASNISLAQISTAFGFLEPITGTVRASKFTFRGNPGEFLDATASIWVELTNFSWRARRADSVMLGATYYDRHLEVDQLYVRQRQNELTINGELLWPKKPSAWSQLPFRGQINATIPDLNGFAQLFGATTGDFTGALLAEGQIETLAPQAHGQIALHGAEVKFRGVALDSLGATLELNGTETKLKDLEARHGEDFLRAHGTIDLAAPHRFSGRLTGAINDLGVYAPLLPSDWRSSKIAGGATFDWRGDGTLAAHSGTMQLFAHGLQLPVAPLRMPLDLTLEGSYSPRDIFFRTFRVANDRVSLGGFLMLGSNFVELQAFELTLDGTPRVSGTLFLPFNFREWRASHNLLTALDEEQKFDVDVVAEHLDLGGLANALGEESALTGLLDGKLAAFGALPSLQLTTTWRLANLGSFRASNSIDFQGRYVQGRADLDATATFGVSQPLRIHSSLPLQLQKDRIATNAVLDQTRPFFLGINCPALFLQDLPNELRFGAESGLLNGDLAFSSTMAAPTISGEVQILEGRLRPPPPWPGLTALTAQIRFGNREAVIDPLRFEVNSIPTSWHGRFSASLKNFSLTLSPQNETIEVEDLPLTGARLSIVRLLGQGTSPDGLRLLDVSIRARIGSTAGLTITTQKSEADPVARTTLFLGSGAEAGSPLLLRVVSPPPRPALQLEIPRPGAAHFLPRSTGTFTSGQEKFAPERPSASDK